MRCVACDKLLGVYTAGDMCGECATIIHHAAQGTYREDEKLDVQEALECINLNVAPAFRGLKCENTPKN